MAKILTNLNWVEELLPKDVLRKPMFGGFAYYLENKLVLVIFESTGSRSYKNKKFKFELWNGCMFPVEREYHADIQKKYTYLINHPVLPKWFYLPLDTEDFDQNVEQLIKEIKKHNVKFGVIPKQKKSKINIDLSIDTSKPRMFSEGSAVERIQKAKKISDLKNLGPVTESAFKKAGIKSVSHFVKLGWKAAMKKLVKSNPKNRHAVFAYALIGALSNIDWNRISENEKQEAKDFCKGLKK